MYHSIALCSIGYVDVESVRCDNHNRLYAMLCYAMLCYATLRYAMLCYAMRTMYAMLHDARYAVPCYAPYALLCYVTHAHL